MNLVPPEIAAAKASAFATAWAALTTSEATVEAAWITFFAVLLGAAVTGGITWWVSRIVARFSEKQHDLAVYSAASQVALARRQSRAAFFPRRWELFRRFLDDARTVRAMIGSRKRVSDAESGIKFQRIFSGLYASSEEMTYIFGADLKEPADGLISCLETLLFEQDDWWAMQADPQADFRSRASLHDSLRVARGAVVDSLGTYFAAGKEFLDFSDDKLSNEGSQSAASLKSGFEKAESRTEGLNIPEDDDWGDPAA